MPGSFPVLALSVFQEVPHPGKPLSTGPVRAVGHLSYRTDSNESQNQDTTPGQRVPPTCHLLIPCPGVGRGGARANRSSNLEALGHSFLQPMLETNEAGQGTPAANPRCFQNGQELFSNGQWLLCENVSPALPHIPIIQEMESI